MDKEYFHFLKKLIQLEEREEFENIRLEFTSLSPSERQLRGKALLALRLAERHYSPAGHFLATFHLENKIDLPIFSLEPGDMVSLLADPPLVDEYLAGTVYERSPDSITVAFHEDLPETLEEGSRSVRFELHRSVNRVTYKRMAEAMDALLQTQNTPLAVLRDISIGSIPPTRTQIAGEKIRWCDPQLNDSQKKAVLNALAAKEVALIHGPPGTGKTTALIELIQQALLRKESVFVTAPSNTACDNLLERAVAVGIQTLRLGHPARIADHLREYTLDFKLAFHPLAKEIPKAEAEITRLQKRLARYRAGGGPVSDVAGARGRAPLQREISLLKQDVRNLQKEVLKRVIKETQVWIGTPTSVQDKMIRDREFDWVIMDEATQATEPMSWIPAAHARKLVMAGDHFQLPPTVRSKEAERQGLGVTLFERFHKILPPEFRALLERQYRMNEKIMGFSSRMFYEGLLVADDSVKQQTLAELKSVKKCEATRQAVLFIDTAGKGFEELLETGSESRYNPQEAELVLEQLKNHLDLGVPPEQIAVISPYSAQVRLLCSRFTTLPSLEIDSVDGFQGREKELVMVTLVRSNLTGEMGFLNDTRRMNVAMTRARRKLIVIGDSATLSSLPFYKRFIEYAESVGGYKTAWEL